MSVGARGGCRWWGGCRWRGGWGARGSLYLLIGLFRVAMSPRSLEGLRYVSLMQGEYQTHISHLVASALHEPHCLSHDFTWLAKPTLESRPVS